MKFFTAMLCFVILLIQILGFSAKQLYLEGDPIVNVKQGAIRGTFGVSAGGREFYLFRGIPHAKPPVGELRFQPPQPPDNYDGIYNATIDGRMCIQFYGLVIGDEDCLFLNVYTPQLPESNFTESIPVLVFIHGGAFDQGAPTSYEYPPEGFMDRDIVLVTIGYRLGPLGFFSTGDDAALGNYGMLDQISGLQWTQENIAAFGGDPARVTIFGQSAGAASVSYHVLSPASAGLFRGAISQSGGAIFPWAFQKDPLSVAIKFAQKLNCSYENSSVLVNCVRGKPAEDLIHASMRMDGYDVLVMPFVPVLENNVTGKFLTDYPLHILETGTFNKVSVITGVTKDEGIATYITTQRYYTTIDDHFYDVILPSLLHFLTKYESNLLNVSYAVKEEYFDKIDIANQSQVITTAIDLNSDTYFKAPNDYTIRKFVEGGIPVFYYAFEYAGIGSFCNFSGEPEVAHADDLAYFFFKDRANFTAEDMYISDTLLDMWTNFAYYLNPTPGGEIIWNQCSASEDLEYLEINADVITTKTGYLTERMIFWNKEVPPIVIG